MSRANHISLARRAHFLLGTLALLAASSAPDTAHAQLSDEQFDQWIFQHQQNAATARRRLDSQLALQVEDVDRACKLAEVQKQKLHLAGRGDIKRFFDSYEAVKQKFQLLKNDQQKMQQIFQDIRPLQTTIQAGLFHEDSLFYKSLRRALTAEQLPKYEALVRERRAFRHRASIELAVAEMEQLIPLRETQRRAVIDLLTRETKPPRRAGNYEYYIIMIQVARFPEEKLRPLLEKTQWGAVQQLLARHQGMEQWLKQSGQWEEADEVADRPAANPMPLP